MKLNADRFLVNPGSKVRLRRFDPADTRPFSAREQVDGRLAKDVVRLSRLQERLYAEQRWALLIVFQAMDAAGKDSVIKHVMSGLNPQGTTVASFKAPSARELAHDFLWRVNGELPERGAIGVFNRSHYEEVLVVRVHPELLDKERLPSDLVTGKVWEQRYEDINAFERHLARSGQSSGSSSCTSRRTNSAAVSWSAWTTRPRTGSSRPRTRTNGTGGATIWRRTKRCWRRPARNTRRGTSSRRTTSGSPT